MMNPDYQYRQTAGPTLVSKRGVYTGKSSWTPTMNGQDRGHKSLALFAEKTVLFSVQQPLKHQKPARKVQYGDMSMTKIPKNILLDMESSTQKELRNYVNS